MSTLTPPAVDDDDPEVSAADDLIPMRERSYQRWQRRPRPDQLASLEPDGEAIAAAAFAAGYMACWGDYRHLILARQPVPER